jgi:hypothetical protein
MAKKKVKAASEDAKPSSIEEASETQVAPETKEKKAKQTSFDVLNRDGGYARTYSVEVHGENAEDLAEEYAKKIGGKVK